MSPTHCGNAAQIPSKPLQRCDPLLHNPEARGLAVAGDAGPDLRFELSNALSGVLLPCGHIGPEVLEFSENQGFDCAIRGASYWM